MALYTAEAIVLAVHNWGEADKLVTFMTKEHGKIKAAAYGCRRQKSPLAAGMQVFNHLELQLMAGQRLDTVKQYELKGNFRSLGEKLLPMAYASFVAELLLELCPEHQPQPLVFDKLRQVLAAFSERNPRVVALAAAYQLLEYTGYQLSFDHCVFCGEALAGDSFFSLEQGGAVCRKCQTAALDEFPAALRQLIISLRDFDWTPAASVSVTGANLVRAERLLLAYLQQLIDKPLKSLAFLQQMADVETMARQRQKE